MSDTQTAPEAAPAQPTETPVVTTEQTATSTETQPKAGGDVGERIHRLLEQEKKPGYKHSDDDLDFLEKEYYSGKNKPSKPLQADKADPDDGEEDSKPEGDDDEAPKREEKPEVSKEVEDAMKEVGAKDPAELASKIKELRKAVSGKDAQAVATLSKEKATLEGRIKSEMTLMKDVKNGVPEALEHFRKVYGLDVVRPGMQQQQQATQTAASEEMPFDADTDALTGGALGKMWAELQATRKLASGVQETFAQEQQRMRDQGARSQAEAMTIDEIVTIAQNYPDLKGAQNLRGIVADWVKNQTDDPRLSSLSELFEIAQKEGVSLTHAYKIKRADDAEKLIAAAREEGRQAAYKHKPNPSLSGLTGGKGETTNYTEAQIEEMVNDHTKHPADWYDEEDRLIEAKIPKRYRHRFGFSAA